MAYNRTIELDQISQSQAGKEATANAVFDALSPAALFGVKASATTGLTLTLYGGNMNIAGEPTPIATQQVTLTASTTNYVYATSAGVVTKVTSAPTGWPGPLAAGAIALYEIVTSASGITSGTNYIVGIGAQGGTGTQGAEGPAGTDLAASRTRVWTANGGGSTTLTYFGWDALTLTGTSTTARTLATTSLRASIPYAAFPSGTSAGNSAQVHNPRNFCYLGNAAGRGGFTLSMRFCMESTSSPATQRSFFGLIPAGTIGNVEPDTLVNVIGIAAKSGEANFSLIHNDGSGTATMTLLESAESPAESPTTHFPARATDNVYELTLTSVANSGIVDYTLTNCNTGDVASGTVSTNIPSNTTFLSWAAWTHNGSTAAEAAFGLMQVVGETRY